MLVLLAAVVTGAVAQAIKIAIIHPTIPVFLFSPLSTSLLISPVINKNRVMATVTRTKIAHITA